MWHMDEDSFAKELRHMVELNFALLRAMRAELERLYDRREELHGIGDAQTYVSLTKAITHASETIRRNEDKFHDELLERLGASSPLQTRKRTNVADATGNGRRK
jgi:hypothetical protein